jgi:hypothetical protein
MSMNTTQLTANDDAAMYTASALAELAAPQTTSFSVATPVTTTAVTSSSSSMFVAGSSSASSNSDNSVSYDQPQKRRKITEQATKATSDLNSIINVFEQALWHWHFREASAMLENNPQLEQWVNGHILNTYDKSPAKILRNLFSDHPEYISFFLGKLTSFPLLVELCKYTKYVYKDSVKQRIEEIASNMTEDDSQCYIGKPRGANKTSVKSTTPTTSRSSTTTTAVLVDANTKSSVSANNNNFVSMPLPSSSLSNARSELPASSAVLKNPAPKKILTTTATLPIVAASTNSAPKVATATTTMSSSSTSSNSIDHISDAQLQKMVEEELGNAFIKTAHANTEMAEKIWFLLRKYVVAQRFDLSKVINFFKHSLLERFSPIAILIYNDSFVLQAFFKRKPANMLPEEYRKSLSEILGIFFSVKVAATLFDMLIYKIEDVSFLEEIKKTKVSPDLQQNDSQYLERLQRFLNKRIAEIEAQHNVQNNNNSAGCSSETSTQNNSNSSSAATASTTASVAIEMNMTTIPRCGFFNSSASSATKMKFEDIGLTISADKL